MSVGSVVVPLGVGVVLVSPVVAVMGAVIVVVTSTQAIIPIVT